MSRQKQIEEMAKIMSKCITSWLNNETPKTLPDYIAEALYTAGYRKQSEGEWVFKGAYYEADECTCSVCGQLLTTAKGKRMNFCPNCGAKLKGDDGNEWMQ